MNRRVNRSTITAANTTTECRFPSFKAVGRIVDASRRTARSVCASVRPFFVGAAAAPMRVREAVAESMKGVPPSARALSPSEGERSGGVRVESEDGVELMIVG
jgi:hypothetical protein